jgi:hypothetical protein
MSTTGTTRSGASLVPPPGTPPQANASGNPPNAITVGPPPNANVTFATGPPPNAIAVGPPPNANIMFAAGPPPNAIVANPPLLVLVVYTYNDITDLNDKPWDLSTHADQARWVVASLADSDHKRIDVSVNTALLLMDLFEDKAFFFGWEQLVSVSLSGDGLFGPASATLSNGKPVMSVNITARANVLRQWTSVSLLACQRYAQWFYGSNTQQLDAPFAPPDNRLVVAINPNAPNNLGLVRHYKIQLRILDKLFLLTIRNHITQKSFKAFLAHKHEFVFCDEKSASVVLSGLILLCKIIDISKLETIVEVRYLEVKLDSIKLWPDMENNVRNLTSKMLQVLQEIHAKSGILSYTKR